MRFFRRRQEVGDERFSSRVIAVAPQERCFKQRATTARDAARGVISPVALAAAATARAHAAAPPHGDLLTTEFVFTDPDMTLKICGARKYGAAAKDMIASESARGCADELSVVERCVIAVRFARCAVAKDSRYC
jgi:hypothetical protein